jgi:hypothetical protein
MRYLKDSSITDEELYRLNNNKWVETAYYLCPCNLVIRHLCLMDLYNRDNLNRDRIFTQLEILSKGGLWSEGYSYWLYTRQILLTYCKDFKDLSMSIYIIEMDVRFAITSYRKKGLYYPAPFGDVANIPLLDEFQFDSILTKDTSFLICQRETTGDTLHFYTVPSPVGFNSHVPIDYDTVLVYNDSVYGFDFYEGFKWDWDKYTNPTVLNVFTIRKYWRQFK